MNTRDQLQIVMPTYNRLNHCRRTLELLLGPDSPVRDFNITVLDNHSTDGTSEYIDELVTRHSNIRHIRNNRNIGANANIARAFEIATYKYLWVICDDDDYDWTGWAEVETAIAQKEKLICVANFNLKPEHRKEIPYLINQMTFLPSIMLNTELISDLTMLNMYEHTFAWFQHLVPVIAHLNAGGHVLVINHPIVRLWKHDVITQATKSKPNEKRFNRGRTMSFYSAYANLCGNVAAPHLRRKCFTVRIAGDHTEGWGYMRFFREVFLHMNGHEADMQIFDMEMQSPFWLRICIRWIHRLSNTFVHDLVCKSWIYRRLRAREDVKNS